MDSDTLSFLLLLMALWWVIAGIVVAKTAGARGHSEVKWFGMAVLVSPVLAAILLLAYPIQTAEELSGAAVDANKIFSHL